MIKRFYYMKGRPMSGASRWTKMDPAERWFSDSLDACEGAGGFTSLEIDMSRYREWLRAQGHPDNDARILIAVIARAAALALARHPALMQMALGARQFHPEHVDVGLSVAGETFLAPMLLLPNADTKTAAELAEEITRHMPEVWRREDAELHTLRTWGWLVPLQSLRRWISRGLMSQLAFRKKIGLIQVTHVPKQDLVLPTKFVATAVLGFGDVKDRVVAVQGKPEVRSTLILSCAANHKVWDGMCVATFLGEIKTLLESEDLNKIL